jgi:hypothetical protein
MLSKKEIQEFCKGCLSRFIKKDYTNFLGTMVDYFTKIIFQMLDYDEDDDIPMDVMKNYILEGKEDSHLLVMFCGADF